MVWSGDWEEPASFRGNTLFVGCIQRSREEDRERLGTFLNFRCSRLHLPLQVVVDEIEGPLWPSSEHKSKSVLDVNLELRVL